MPKSYYLSTGIINHVLRGADGPPLPRPSSLYLALFTSPPSESGGGTEVVGGGYYRIPAVFGPPVDGRTSNPAEARFPDTNAPWGTVGHWGIFDANVGGNLLYLSHFDIPRTIQAGERFVVPAGQLVVVEF